MNKSKLLVLSLAAISSVHAGSLDIQPESIRMPSRLAGVSVAFDDGSFYVAQGAQTAKVESYNLDKSLRDISSTNLKTYLDHGYLMLNQNSDSEYTLKSNIRVLGGGNWFVETAKNIGNGAKGVQKGIRDVTHGTADSLVGIVTGDKGRVERSGQRIVKGTAHVVLPVTGAVVGSLVGGNVGGGVGFSEGHKLAKKVEAHLKK